MQYKQINNTIVCVRNNGTVLYGPDTFQYLEDETIPWQETNKEIIRLSDHSFVFSDDPIAINALKQPKKAYIAAARYNYEIAGIVFKNVHVTTDREDQAMITAIALSATLNNDFTTVWKGSDGYIDLNAQEVLTLAYLVAEHVEAAFAEEKRLAELIDSAQTEEELNSIVWSLKI